MILPSADPSASPTGLSVVDSTANSCWLNWTAIPEEDTNGEKVSYEVHVVKNESADQGSPTTVLACGRATEANVTMSDAFSTYNIKVAFHNNFGSGNYSDTVVCITGEAGRGWLFCFNFILLPRQNKACITKLILTNLVPDYRLRKFERRAIMV